MKYTIIILTISLLLLSACSSSVEPEKQVDVPDTLAEDMTAGQDTQSVEEGLTTPLQEETPEEDRIACESFSDCPGDMDCGDEGFCTGPDCGECQYEEDFACYYYSCCSNEDCRDWETCINHECYEEGEYPEEDAGEPEVLTKTGFKDAEEDTKEDLPGSFELMDCGNDVSCLKDNSKDCIQSKGTVTATVEYMGLEQTTTNYVELTPEVEKCRYFQRTEENIIKYSDAKKDDLRSQGLSEDEIDQKESESAAMGQAAIGATRSCIFENDDLYAVMSNWEQGSFSTSDFDKCE